MDDGIIEAYDREERALYNPRDWIVEGCMFVDFADGESALKEYRDIEVAGCTFALRYSF